MLRPSQSFVGGTVASAAVWVSLAVACTLPAEAKVEPGTPAPQFTATDSYGKTVALSELKGKTVVLEWTNHLCPYTAKHYATGNMQALQREATESGVVWFSVISSAPGKEGYVTGPEANQLTEKRKARPTAVLLDPKGELGRLYGASTTPHMFIIDPAGKLVYMGAIDDRPTASQSDVKGARNYVREVLAALRSAQPIATPATRPYGCSVKY
jgi:peroxiredoxin